MRRELKILAGIGAVFLALFHLPVQSPRFQGAVLEALTLARWYAREHVLLCLVPAFFIAGAIGVFIRREAVLRTFGPRANKALAYGVASVSGTILAVCSCTVLPMFGGIYLHGAGLGPATTFLYSGQAINALAIILTARVLGAPLGIARAVAAVVFSIAIGLLMHLVFRRGERARAAAAAPVEIAGGDEAPERSLGRVALHFLALLGILVFANVAEPSEPAGFWHAVYRAKWLLTAGAAVGLGLSLWRSFGVRPRRLALAAAAPAALALAFPERPALAFSAGAAGLVALLSTGSPELREWRDQSWGFAKQILPLLLGGVLAAGFFLGSPESRDAGIVPNAWIEALVGDSPHGWMALRGLGDAPVPAWLDAVWPLWTNAFAAVAGALMYFATLTEVPILRGLLDSGMGPGPALALLLAGPAVSLPNLLVIGSILGARKTLVFTALVVVMATVAGLAFGAAMGG